MVTIVVRVRFALLWLYAALVGLAPGALIVTGVALWSGPAAFVTAGALLVLDRFLPDERG